MIYTYTITMNLINPDNSIEDIIKENKIHRFALELQDTTDETRKSDIRVILHMLQGNVDNNNEQKTQSKLEDLYKKQDECTLRRKWSRLQTNQKLEKMKEYVNTNIKDTVNKQSVILQLTELINDNRLTHKYVDYDVPNSVILTISILKQNTDNQLYEVETIGKSKSKPKAKGKATKKTNVKHDTSDDSDASSCSD